MIEVKLRNLCETNTHRKTKSLNLCCLIYILFHNFKVYFGNSLIYEDYLLLRFLNSKNIWLEDYIQIIPSPISILNVIMILSQVFKKTFLQIYMHHLGRKGSNYSCTVYQNTKTVCTHKFHTVTCFYANR